MEYNLDKILLQMLGSMELVKGWWDSSNRAFEGATPQQVFNGPDYYKVVDYIVKHSDGQGY